MSLLTIIKVTVDSVQTHKHIKGKEIYKFKISKTT